MPMSLTATARTATLPTATLPTGVAPTSGRLDLDVEPLATAALSGPPTALVIDLDPIVGIHLAAELSRRRLASVVLIVPRWPHADAVLPCDGLLGALLDGSRRVRDCPSAPHVVFVLDAERSKSITRPALDPRIDNRYDLAVGDLPTLRQLRCAGIERVVKLLVGASA